MNRPALCLALLFAGTLLGDRASARVASLDWEPVLLVESPGDALCSAYYQRDTGLDRAAPAATAAEGRVLLQRHFGLVLATLAAESAESLDVALARLEIARGETWTAADRDAWRQTLALRRLANIRRLRLYQLRGVFPQNEHVADRAVPVFVDNYDTACAVGHLMRESGYGDAVAAIQRMNNLVFVTDVHEGPLVDWVLVSGLTQEEAAMIQPAYGPPPFNAMMNDLVVGGSVTNNGLKYDNFRMSAGIWATAPNFPLVIDQLDRTRVGVSARTGVFNNFEILDPLYDDWLFTGGLVLGDLGDVGVGVDWGVIYSFDVEAIDAGKAITGVSLESPATFTFNFLQNPPTSRIDLDTDVASATNPALADLHLDSTMNQIPGFDFLNGTTSATFAATTKLSVFTIMRGQSQVQLTSFVHSFQVVPEPATPLLALTGCALVFAIARRRT